MELVLLDASDQLSAGLLRKILAGEPLTELQQADFASYYERYVAQNGSFDLGDLTGITPDQVYGFPYAGLSQDKHAYASSNFTFMERLFGREKTASDAIFSDALVKSGFPSMRSEDLLPSSMQWRDFFAVHDALTSSPLASAGYVGASLYGASYTQRNNVAKTIAGIVAIGGSAAAARTGLMPVTGSLGVNGLGYLRGVSTGVPQNKSILLPGYVNSLIPSDAIGFSRANVLSPASVRHIINGEIPGGGGHMWPGMPGKTVFPHAWGQDKILHEVSDIATSPSTTWYAQTGSGGLYTKSGLPARWAAFEIRDGVRIRVIYEPASGRVITAFPDSSSTPSLKPIR